MRNPFENLGSVFATERMKCLAGGVGFSALSGVTYGLEAGLLEKYTSLGIITAATMLPVATTSLAIGVSMHDRFLHPSELSKSDETTSRL